VTGRQDQLIGRFMDMRTKVHGFVWAIVGDYQVAEDVFQETSVVVLKQWAKFRPGTNFSAWVMGIARRVALKHRRKLSRSRREIPARAVDNLESAFGAGEDDRELQARRAALRKCLARIRPDQRQLISDRYMAGRRITDMARALNATAEAVRARIKRLREILFQCVSSLVTGGEVGQ
jgi:RNA polymerase sigma-70 factor (ECF subfamily)